MNRQQFLKLTLGTAGALATQSSWANVFNNDEACGKHIKDFGLQLWSIRDAMEKDAKGSLKLLSEYGYKKIESFGGAKGVFWGMQPKEFKTYINDLGMVSKSCHCIPDANFEKLVKDAAAAEIEYLVYAWEGADKKIEDYKKLADDFNKWGKLCKDNGIQFAFHNHNYTFELREGQYAQDLLMNSCDADLVKYQMDIYWVVAAGQDPIAWLKKYPNRFKLSHVKDRSIGATTNDASCVLGTGQIDFKKVLKVAKKNGMEHFMVEQEKYTEGTSMECAARNSTYMKKLKI